MWQGKIFKNKLWLPPVFAVFLCVIFFGSCNNDGIIAERFSRHERAEAGTITALVPAPDTAMENPASPRIILEKGNYWTAGIPGFGENALSALAGEYRVPEKAGTVKVWLTMEFIYYDGWAARNSVPGMPFREKMGNDGHIIAAAINDNWTLVAQFPPDAEVSTREEDRIILDILGKCTGLSGQSHNVSLPAIIAFNSD